jgi:hypothetical protein
VAILLSPEARARKHFELWRLLQQTPPTRHAKVTSSTPTVQICTGDVCLSPQNYIKLEVIILRLIQLVCDLILISVVILEETKRDKDELCRVVHRRTRAVIVCDIVRQKLLMPPTSRERPREPRATSTLQQFYVEVLQESKRMVGDRNLARPRIQYRRKLYRLLHAEFRVISDNNLLCMRPLCARICISHCRGLGSKLQLQSLGEYSGTRQW